MASASRAVAPNPSGWLWLSLVCLGACKLGAATPTPTSTQPALAVAAAHRDAAPASAADAPAIADCAAPFGKLLAEVGQHRLVDMVAEGDSLLLLIEENTGREASVLHVRTERALAEPKLIGTCRHGADRIAVDANYVFLPCLGSRSADWSPKQLDPSLNYDGYVSAIALDGSALRTAVAKARRPFWIGTDSSFVYWFDRSVLYRLPRPQPGQPFDELPPERFTQRMASRDVFVGSDGIYFQGFGGYIARVAPSPRCVRSAETGSYADVSCSTGSGRTDLWKAAEPMRLLGVNPRNELFVGLDRQPNDVFRFVPESGALVHVARIDQPVTGILWLPEGGMLARSADTIWRTTLSGSSPASTTRWRQLPRTIVGWAANDRTLYLALAGAPLAGLGVYALPLACGPAVEPGGGPR